MIIDFINDALSRVGMVVIQRSYLDELIGNTYDLAFAAHQQQRAEAELEECRIERDALKIKVALLNLRYEAEAIGYEVHWLNEGEGEDFTLIAQDDSVDFKQTLEDIDHALEIVLHDAAVIAEQEAEKV